MPVHFTGMGQDRLGVRALVGDAEPCEPHLVPTGRILLYDETRLLHPGDDAPRQGPVRARHGIQLRRGERREIAHAGGQSDEAGDLAEAGVGGLFLPRRVPGPVEGGKLPLLCRAQRNTGRRHAERIEQAFAQELLVGPSGDALDDMPEQRVAVVRIVERLADLALSLVAVRPAYRSATS